MNYDLIVVGSGPGGYVSAIRASQLNMKVCVVEKSEIGGICHAGEFETSIMLYIYPDKVNMNNLKKRDVKYVPTLDPNYDKEKLKNWKTIDLNQSGILGDPFHSSIRKGELWFNFLIKKISASVKDFLNT